MCRITVHCNHSSSTDTAHLTHSSWVTTHMSAGDICWSLTCIVVSHVTANWSLRKGWWRTCLKKDKLIMTHHNKNIQQSKSDGKWMEEDFWSGEALVFQKPPALPGERWGAPRPSEAWVLVRSQSMSSFEFHTLSSREPSSTMKEPHLQLKTTTASGLRVPFLSQ